MNTPSEIFKTLISKTYDQQRSPEWFKIRHNMLTATNVSSVLECNPFNTKFELLKEKTMPLEVNNSISNDAINWGIKYESVAIKIFEEITNDIVYNIGLVKHNNISWLGASPDGIRKCGKLLEIKCLWKRKLIENTPEYIWIQVQIQMEVCNLDECDLFQCKFTEFTSKKEYLYCQGFHKGIINESNGQKTYWKLEEYSLKTIKRDKMWFIKIYPILNDFWNDVCLNRNELLPKKLLKRKTNYELNQSKRKICFVGNYKLFNISEWISASSVRNYMLNDTILDWLNKFGCQHNIKPDPEILEKYNFNTFIKQQGNIFEDSIFKNLIMRFSSYIIKVSEHHEAFSTNKALITLQHMKNGIPIIYKGVLHNHKNKTFGIPDLIVREDYIHKIFKNLDIDISNLKTISKINWKYYIIEIKYSTLKLKKHSNLICRTSTTDSYKAQCFIYNDALGEILGYVPKFAFILGRRTIINKNSYFNPFYTPGLICTEIYDNNIYLKTQLSINWIRDLNNNGHMWTISPPSRKELYPNMSNKSDYPWHSIKSDISNKINEITMMWKYGHNERNQLHSKGIYKWTDILLSSNLDSFNYNHKKTIQQIINVNSSSTPILYDDSVKTLKSFTKIPKLELFVDFEMINNLSDNFNYIENYNVSTEEVNTVNYNTGIINIIGMGWINPCSNKWNYINFIAQKNDKDSEHCIIIEWLNYIKYLKTKYKFSKTIDVYHWGHAEPSTLNKIFNINPLMKKIVNMNWIDMCNIFRKGNIVVNGVFDFGLKHIAFGLYNLGLIKTKWLSNNIDGLSAMYMSWKCYIESDRDNILITDIKEMQEVIAYNEVDCKVIWDILSMMRKILK